MLYINDEKVTIQEILKGRGGDDQIKATLCEKFDFFTDKFFSKGKVVQLKWRKDLMKKNPKSGLKEGKKGIFIPFYESVQTDRGSFSVRYAEYQEDVVGGGKKYKPRGLWFNGKKTFGAQDVELLLFLYAISSTVVKGNKIVLVDAAKDADETAAKRKEMSALDFYIYNEDSPLSGDSVKMTNLCLAWGVSDADKLTFNQMRNKLYSKVKLSEQSPTLKHDFGYKAFVEAIKKETPFMAVSALVQKAIDKDTLVWHNESMEWRLQDPFNKKLFKTLMSVPVAEASRKEATLVNYLLTVPEKYESLKKSVGIEEREVVEEDSHDDVDSDVLHKALDQIDNSENISMSTLYKLAKEVGLKLGVGKSKVELIKVIKNHIAISLAEEKVNA